MPTIQGTDTFFHNDFTVPGGGPYAAVVGTPTRDLAIVHPGDPASLLIDATAAAEYVEYDISGAPTIGWHGFWWRMDTEPASDQDVARLIVSGGAAGRIAYSPGENALYHYITGASFPSIAYTLSTWVWIEQILDVASGTRSLRTQVGGVDLTGVDEAFAAATVTDSRLGITAAGTVEERYSHSMWGTASSLTDWNGEPDDTGLAWITA